MYYKLYSIYYKRIFFDKIFNYIHNIVKYFKNKKKLKKKKNGQIGKYKLINLLWIKIKNIKKILKIENRKIENIKNRKIKKKTNF